jgi:hypothetical protein
MQNIGTLLSYLNVYLHICQTQRAAGYPTYSKYDTNTATIGIESEEEQGKDHRNK